MTVSNATLTPGIGQGAWRSTVKQARQDFEQLFQSMQAGDLSGAQQAYAAFQQLRPNLSDPAAGGGSTADASAQATTATSAASSASSASMAGTISGDWSSLGQALQSGNMSSAQDAFAKLQGDLRTVPGGHHRHHGDVDKAQSVYSAMQPGTEAGSATQGTGNALGSDIDGLKQALQSGNVGSAQDLLARLEQDLKSSGQQWGHHYGHGGFAQQSAAAGYQAVAASSATATAAAA